MKVPEGLPRFLEVGKRRAFVPLEDVIAHFLDWLFPGMEIVERAVFRVTRDADFEVSDEADDLLEAVELEVRRRRFGDVVRLEVSRSVSNRMLGRLRRGSWPRDEQVYPIRGLLDLADLSQLAGLDRPDLKDEPWVPITPARSPVAAARDFFSEIRRGDMLVHHPYDSFVTTFERSCGGRSGPCRDHGEDDRLSHERRLGARSGADRGGRGGEAERLPRRAQGPLRRAPQHRVVASDGACRRPRRLRLPEPQDPREDNARRAARGDDLRRYVHIGTGNYHALTARIYEDFGLFTADEEIAADVADLFNYVTGFGRPQAFRKLLVAPFNLRKRLVEEIRAVAEAAAEASTRGSGSRSTR